MINIDFLPAPEFRESYDGLTIRAAAWPNAALDARDRRKAEGARPRASREVR